MLRVDPVVNELDIDVGGTSSYGQTIVEGVSNTPADSFSGLYSQEKKRGLLYGKMGILLGSQLVYEIIEQARLTPFPGVKSVFKGIVNHRGNIVPVYDLYELMNEEAPAWERNRLLIINTGREALAFVLYDLPLQVEPVVKVREHEVINVPDIFLDNASSVYRLDGIIWLALDNKEFFSILRDFSLFSSEDRDPI